MSTVTGESLTVGSGRRGGRPKAPVPGSRVSTWVPVPTHNQLIRIANRRGVSVSALLRELAVRATTKP